jgi:Na+/proline symporter
VWVNIFQTILFLLFGAVAVTVISHSLPGGFGEYIKKIMADPAKHTLLTREKMPPQFFWSYTLIPLSSIMFPHMAIMCFSAKKITAFKRTVVYYPLAIMAIWLPCVFLGVIGTVTLTGKVDPDGVLLRMLDTYAPAWLAGILGAGIISAVMGSDAHQVLALSTMFTKDVFAHYGGKEKFGERGSVYFARAFILIVTVIAYVIALELKTKQGIFEIAIRYAFSGFAAMAPVMVAALFWKRSTKWGALAATLFVAISLIGSACLQGKPAPRPTAPKMDATTVTKPTPPTKPKEDIIWKIGQGPDAIKILSRSPATGDVRFMNNYLTVVPMVIGSAFFMILFSLLTRPPSQQTIDRYFGRSTTPAQTPIVTQV